MEFNIPEVRATQQTYIQMKQAMDEPKKEGRQRIARLPHWPKDLWIYRMSGQGELLVKKEIYKPTSTEMASKEWIIIE